MRPFLALLQKHFRILYRDPQVFILLLVLPFMLTSLLAIAFEQLAVGKPQVEVRLIDEDDSQASRELITRLAESDEIDIDVRRGSDSGDIERLLDESHFAVLLVPSGFEDMLLAEGRAVLQVHGDPARKAYVNIINEQLQDALRIGYLGRAVASAVVESGDEQVRAAVDEAVSAAGEGANLSTLPASEDSTFPSAYEQTVPGFAIMFGFFGASLLAVHLFREKSAYATWRRTFAAPVPRLTVLGAIVASYAALSFVQLAVLLGLGRLVWSMELGSEPGALVLLIGAWSVAGAAIGLAVTLLLGLSRSAVDILNLGAVLLGALGGALVAVAFLPEWVRPSAPFMPQYWAVDGMQGIIAHGDGLADILPHLGVLLAFGIISLLVSARAASMEARS
jgi:ABC-2 type transport system permease protein